MIFGPGNWENREEKRKKEKKKVFSQRKILRVFFWKFCDQNGIKKITYRGNALEGPGTLKLLSKLDLLEASVPARLKNFVTTFKAFNVLYNSCFQMELDGNWEKHLDDFKTAFKNLKWHTKCN